MLGHLSVNKMLIFIEISFGHAWAIASFDKTKLFNKCNGYRQKAGVRAGLRMRRTAEDSAEVLELLCQSVTPGSRGVCRNVTAICEAL